MFSSPFQPPLGPGAAASGGSPAPFVGRDLVWVDLRYGPGGSGNEQTPFNTVNAGFGAPLPDGGTLMFAGGDASTEPGITLGGRSFTCHGLSGQRASGGLTPVLPTITYAISTGTQRVALHNVSCTLVHSGTSAGLSEFSFESCPSITITGGTDTSPVYWRGNSLCTLFGASGAAELIGGTVSGYTANGSGTISASGINLTGALTSSTAIVLVGGCTFGAGASITAPSIGMDAASHRNAILAGVSFSSTVVVLAAFGTPVDIGNANSAGTDNLFARRDHVHNIPFSALQTALAAATSSVSFNGQRITSLANPVNPSDAVTKSYADALAVGLKLKDPAVAVATANQATRSGTAQTIDGVALNTVGMRALLTAQSTATQNGLWVIQSGAWTRPTDFATGGSAALAYVPITGGTVYTGSGWLDTDAAGSDVIDTSNLTFKLFLQPSTITAGNGLSKTGNVIAAVPNADGSIVIGADIKVGVLATDAQHGNRGGGGLHSVVTTSVAGFMSAADKTKLDGITGTGVELVGKAPVRAATTANITLSGTQVIDGVSVIAGDRVLVKDQTTGSQNGIYVVAAGAWARAADADATGELLAGMVVPIGPEGTANGKRVAQLTTADPITVGTTALTFQLDRIVPVGSATPQDISSSGPSGGTSNNAARENHVHQLTFPVLAAVLALANASVSVNGQKITNVALPTVSTDAATKGYVDTAISTAIGTTVAPANPGDNGKIVYANGGALAFASAVKTDGTYVSIGSAPATSGSLRLAYGGSIQSGNNAGLGSPYSLIQSAQVFGVDNSVLIGDNASPKVETWVSAAGVSTLRFNGTLVGSVSANAWSYTQQPVNSGPAPVAFTLTGAAHTGLTASSEPRDVTLNLTRTVTLAAGAITLARAARVTAPTYAFASASTIAMAATFAIAAPPTAGANATITNPLALLIENGAIGLSTSAAQSGLIRGPGNSLLLAARGTVTAIDVPAVSVDGSDHLVLGGSGTNSPTANYYNTRTGGLHTFQVNATDLCSISSTIFDFKNLVATFGTTGLPTQGSIRFPASPGLSGLWWRTNSTGQDIAGLFSGTDDVMYLGDGVQSAGVNLRTKATGFVQTIIGGVAILNNTASSLTFAQQAVTSGAPPVAFSVLGAAHTGLTASTEPRDISLSLGRTVTMSAGTLSTARAVYLTAPTYAFGGASTITTAATLAISGPPVAGTNATLTARYAVLIESAAGGGVAFGALPARFALICASYSASGQALVSTLNSSGGEVAALSFTAGNHVQLGSGGTTSDILTPGGTWSFGVTASFPGVAHAVAANGHFDFGTTPSTNGVLNFTYSGSGQILVASTDSGGFSRPVLSFSSGSHAQLGSGNISVDIISSGGTWAFGNTASFPGVDHNIAASGRLTFGSLPASGGTIAFSYGGGLLWRNKLNSGDRTVLFFGLDSATDDTLILGDTGVRLTKYRNQSGPHQFEVGGSVAAQISTGTTSFFSALDMGGNRIVGPSYIQFPSASSPGNPSTLGWNVYCSSSGDLLAISNTGTVRTLALH